MPKSMKVVVIATGTQSYPYAIMANDGAPMYFKSSKEVGRWLDSHFNAPKGTYGIAYDRKGRLIVVTIPPSILKRN